MFNGECLLEVYHPLEYVTINETNRSRGGVGMYVRDDLHYTKRHDLSVFIGKIESIFIEINNGNQNIIIGTVYRPNSGSKKDTDNSDTATQKQRDLDVYMHCMHELQQLLMAYIKKHIKWET